MNKLILLTASLLLVGAGCAGAPKKTPTPAPAEPRQLERPATYEAPAAPEGWKRHTSALGVTFLYPVRVSADVDDEIAFLAEGSTLKLFASKNPSFSHSIEVGYPEKGQAVDAYLQGRLSDEARAAGCAYRREEGTASLSGRRIHLHVMSDLSGGGALSPCPGAGATGRTLSSPDVPGVVLFVSLGQDTFMGDPETFLNSVEPIPPTP